MEVVYTPLHIMLMFTPYIVAYMRFMYNVAQAGVALRLHSRREALIDGMVQPYGSGCPLATVGKQSIPSQHRPALSSTAQRKPT